MTFTKKVKLLYAPHTLSSFEWWVTYFSPAVVNFHIAHRNDMGASCWEAMVRTGRLVVLHVHSSRACAIAICRCSYSNLIFIVAWQKQHLLAAQGAQFQQSFYVTSTVMKVRVEAGQVNLTRCSSEVYVAGIIYRSVDTGVWCHALPSNRWKFR